MIRKRILALLVIVLMPCASASSQDAGAVIDGLKDKYDTIGSLRASFTQTMASAFIEESQNTSGVLVLQGDKYRVETGNQTIVTDGVVTWVYNADAGQLLINDYEEDETSFSISDFFFHFDERYEVSAISSAAVDGAAHHRLELLPRDPASFFTGVTLWVRKSDNLITSLRVVDANETEMTFGLDRIELNPQVDDATFSFQPPDGTEVLDLRS